MEKQHKLSLKEENDRRFKKLTDQQKQQLKTKLIWWRVGSFFGLNIVLIILVGFIIGPVIWLIAMLTFLDKYLVKWAINSLEKN